MEQTIKAIEDNDGIRLTWNIWPTISSKLEVVPIACLYNVLQPAFTLPYEPISCHKCHSVLCPQSLFDFGNLTWTCVFCNSMNSLPAHLRSVTSENPIPELMDENTSIVYTLNRTTTFSPVFFLIVDQCTYDSERHELMKKGVKKALELIPDDSMVGLLLFGTNIDLISFGGSEMRTIYEFSGKQGFKKEDMTKLNILDIRNFLVKKSEKFDDLCDIIDNLEVDPFPVISGYRNMRCTGAAISFAISFLENTFSESPVKYMLFTQGPCTVGPGKVSMLEIAENSQERLDLEAAKLFYQELSERMNSVGHSIDIIAETIADVGLEQFKSLISYTGGTLVMAQDFDEGIILKSIAKLFEVEEDGALKTGFNVKIQVKTSQNIVFKGFIGDGRPLGSGWRVGSLLPCSNLTLLFENNLESKNESFGYVQIVSQYQRSDRKLMTKVTTFNRMFSDDRYKVFQSFDQEASCVFQSRAFISKDYQNILDFEAAIDKNLIKFTKKYGSYEKNNPMSVVLPDSMSYYPNFMFFFRRSLLVQKDGISNDESAYFKLLLYKLKPSEAIKMIKPSLIAFHYQGDISPVELDTSNLNPESLLVLDSFHNVLLWRGKYVSDWIREGLHENPEYNFFKDAINEATSYSLSLLDRIPVPQYKDTCEGMSQERILLHYVNPSQQGVLNTEKIDYSKFYETLCRFIVRNE